MSAISWLELVGIDKKESNLSLTAFLGQRYHVVLNANPIDNGDLSPEGNYWIRAIPTDGCKGFETGNEPDERQGVLRYNHSSIEVPTSFRGPFSKACRDENYDRLEPIHPWNVTPVELIGGFQYRTNTSLFRLILNDRAASSSQFRIGKDSRIERPAHSDNFTWWSFGDDPLWLNFSNPTILNLQNTTWDKDYVIIPEDYPANSWVYLVITAPASVPSVSKSKNRTFIRVAHPVSPF